MASISRIVLGIAIAGILVAGISPGTTPLASSLPDAFTLGAGYVPLPTAADGRIYVEEGFEGDLADILGQRFGRPVRLKAAEAGGVDALDGTVLRLPPDDPRLASGAALALGYRSGLSVAMRSDTAIRRWADLAGRTVCASEANAEGQRLARSHGARVVVARAPAVALMQLRTGACDASIHDRVLLDALFTSRAWAKFSATLPPTQPTVLALVPAPTASGEILRQAVPALADAAAWRQRQARWGATVAFEVYRDQVGGDCH